MIIWPRLLILIFHSLGPGLGEFGLREFGLHLMESLALVQDVQTRWNSTYNMLKRAAKLKLAVDLYVSTDSSLSGMALTAIEWFYVDEIIAIL